MTEVTGNKFSWKRFLKFWAIGLSPIVFVLIIVFGTILWHPLIIIFIGLMWCFMTVWVVMISIDYAKGRL